MFKSGCIAMRHLLTSLIVISSIFADTSIAKYSGGTGTISDPYLIYMAIDLNSIGANLDDWGKCFKLMADIDMSAYTGNKYKIIGNSVNKFTGKFDGNGYIINNLTCNSSEGSIGLFGYTDSGSEIKNLGLENINIAGKYDVGGLVGYNAGTITSCHTTGSVSGIFEYSRVGGLVGCNSGTITSCFANTSISGGVYLAITGGLAGINWGTLTSCYSTGSVTGTDSVGGLVGSNWGTLTFCYANGTVSARLI